MSIDGINSFDRANAARIRRVPPVERSPNVGDRKPQPQEQKKPGTSKKSTVEENPRMVPKDPNEGRDFGKF